MKDAARAATLKSSVCGKYVRLAYADMQYIGLWHKPESEAPYVCIEPWTVLPGREGIVEDLEKMEDMTALEPGKTHVNAWKIEVW